MAGLGHQHLVAGRQRVDDRRLPGAGARRGKDDHRAGGLEDLLAALEHRLAELGEFGAAVVDDRHVHGAEHAVRHRAGPGNLQEMASLMLRSWSDPRPYRRLRCAILHSIFSRVNAKIASHFRIDARAVDGLCSDHETPDSADDPDTRSCPEAPPTRRPAREDLVAARRDPGPPARLHRRRATWRTAPAFPNASSARC